jgi:hypothetical protein
MTRVVNIADCSHQPRVSSADADSVIWLGAGFSRCATEGKAPLMRDFFADIDESRFSHLYRYLSARCNPVHAANVEEVLLAVEQMEDCPLPPRLRHSILSAQNPKTVRHELERYSIERLSFGEIDSEHWAAEFLAEADHRTTVITTNYDTVAELILSNRTGAVHCGVTATCHHCNMRAILAEDCNCDANSAPPVVGGRNAPLLKLHGSIAWHVCRNAACSITDCLIARCNCQPCASPRCTCCGDSCKPVLVLPSMKKTFSSYPQLGRMWERAHAAVKGARTFAVFGFSFPQSDCLICDVVRDAFNSSDTLNDVIVIDVDPSRIAERIVSLLPQRRDVTVVLCPVPRDGTIPNWWPRESAAPQLTAAGAS